MQAALLMAGGVILLASTVRLVRMGLLSIRYGLGWLFVAALGIVGAPVLSALSDRVRDLGFTPTGFSLGVLVLFLGLVCLQLSMSVSGLHRAIQELSEHGALLANRVAGLERGGAPVADDPPAADPPGWERNVLVVLPAYNEQEAVGGVVRAVRELGYPACVVDDGSRDRTSEAAREAGADVVRLPFNLGVGGALRAGFRHALLRGYDVVVQVDADGQHDVRDIPALVRELQHSGADMVVGSRFGHEEVDYPVSWSRRLAMRVLALRATRATGATLTDATSGFRAIGPTLLERFAFEYPVEYLGDTVEALIIAGEHGATATEHPVRMMIRSTGRPSAGPLASVWYVLRVMLAIELMRGRRAEPPPPLPSDHGAGR
jgi:hypothetical protein